MPNCFEQVDEPQPDALNLILSQTGSGQNGRVFVAASAMQGENAKDVSSPEMPIVDAFRSAVKLANDFKLAIVVIDPNKLWRARWGELFRDGDEVPGAS